MPGMHIAKAPAEPALATGAFCLGAWCCQPPFLSGDSSCGASLHLLLPCHLLQASGVLCKLPLLWRNSLDRGGDEAAPEKQTWRLLPAQLEAILQPSLQVNGVGGKSHFTSLTLLDTPILHCVSCCLTSLPLSSH